MDTSDSAFSADLVQDMLYKTFEEKFPKDMRDWLPIEGNAVFLTCDPNGGGSSSFAVWSGVSTKFGSLILGVENEPLKYPVSSGAEFIYNHVVKLSQRYPFVKTATIALLIESNNLVGDAIWSRIQQTPEYANAFNWEMLWQGKAVGLHTSHPLKNAMVHRMQDVLHRHTIAFVPMSALVTHCDASKLEAELVRQFRDFKEYSAVNAKGTGITTTYSGKKDGMSDDMVVAGIIFALHSANYLTCRQGDRLARATILTRGMFPHIMT